MATDEAATEDRRRVKALFREWDALAEPLTTPIVYHPGGWEDTIPDELKKEVIRQRLEKQANGGWDEATDAEVLCYLSTCSLVQPLTSDWTHIFLFEGALFMPGIRDAIPDTPKELSDYQQSELGELKRKIRASQIRQRKQRAKGGTMSKRKLVLEEREGSVLMGVQQEGCDPQLKTVEGTLEGALAEIPPFLTEAQEKWTGSPRNPTFTPPQKPRKAPAAAATPAAAAQTTGDLPLLAGQEQPASEAVVTTEATTEAVPEASVTAGPVEGEPGQETPVFPAEETPAVEEGETPAPDPEEASDEPETEVASLEATPDQATEAAPVEETTADEAAGLGPERAEPVPEPTVAEAAPTDTAAISERIAAAPAPPQAPRFGNAEWEYYLQDGRGPYTDIQKAMDAMGMDKENRPHHNRWDRLSTQLKNQIPRRAKA